MARCASPGPGGHRCADRLAHPGPIHTEGDGSWPLYAQERTALAVVDRLALTGDDRVRVYAATLEQLNREDEAARITDAQRQAAADVVARLPLPGPACPEARQLIAQAIADGQTTTDADRDWIWSRGYDAGSRDTRQNLERRAADVLDRMARELAGRIATRLESRLNLTLGTDTRHLIVEVIRTLAADD